MSEVPLIHDSELAGIRADDTVEQIQTMKREIDGLQIAFTSQKKKPWYLDVTTLIALVAFLFSFGTTIVSYFRTKSQEIQTERQELRGLLQRLSAIPRENLEASKKYSGDTATINGMSQLYNQENALLSRQAAEIAKRLPKGVPSATEFYAIGSSLQSSYNLSGAKEFYSYAAQGATDFNDQLAATRSIANLDFLTGQPNAGREMFKQALDLFAKYPNYDQYTVNSTQINTELGWAISEASIGEFALANQHIDSAAGYVQRLSASPGSDGLRMQVDQTRQMISRGTQLPSTTPVLQAPSVPGTQLPTKQ